MSVEAATLEITARDTRTGNALKGVSVTVTTEVVEGSGAGARFQGISDVSGALTIPDLSAGTYTITATVTGYIDATIADVALAADETKSIKIELSPEVIQLEQVSVTASRRREKVLEAPASVALVGTSAIRDRVCTKCYRALKIGACGGCYQCWIGSVVCCRSWFQ